MVGGMTNTFHNHNQNGLWGAWGHWGRDWESGRAFRGLVLFTNWQESSSVLIAQTTWVQVLVLPLPSWVTLGESLPCAMPQFPPSYNAMTTAPESAVLSTTLQTAAHRKGL